MGSRKAPTGKSATSARVEASLKEALGKLTGDHQTEALGAAERRKAEKEAAGRSKPGSPKKRLAPLMISNMTGTRRDLLEAAS